MKRRPLLLLPLATLACGCNDMVHQPRYDPYDSAALFDDGKVLQAPPEGTVARDLPQRLAAAERPPMSLDLVRRGRERYEINCSMCHGYDGSGNGTVPARGFPQPPSLVAGPARDPAFVYRVITEGYGVMYSHADRVEPRDRWAIAAYVQALRLSQGGSRGGGDAG